MKLSLLPLALGGLTIGITEFVMMGLLPDIAQDLKISIPTAGHLISAYAIGVVVGAPLLVIAGRNYPPKKMLLAMAAMLTVFNALSIIAPGYNLLLVSRFLSGLPHGAFFGVGAVVASRLAVKGKEAQSVAVMFSGLTVANVVGVPLGTYIGHNFTWRYTFVIIAIIGLITFISLIAYLPKIETGKTTNIKTQLTFFSKPQAWLVMFITAIGCGGLFCWISYIAPLLTDISGFDAENVPYILMLAGVGMVAGNLVGARLADKFSPAHTVFAVLIGMGAILTGVYFLSANQYLSLTLVFLTGFTAFALIAPVQMMMIQTAKGAEMIASAAIQASFNIGNALGAFLGGLPIVYGYSYAAPNLVGVGMALIGALATVVFIKTAQGFVPLTAGEKAMMH
ncbi:membrane protein [Flavobacterium rivuli WB 3.3-2 = DSM 21788]|uniref:Membrane protein n=1 Tax=Flavobacterium rivuli WB 3.3-2 = DSM 21788 TaxID=1121895 RepID=A0A0A2M3A9_9FLAO|nr:MFS transporter [Flavobacterium rivuli]KGO87117.1 membrane protein [Flavobacterium rivuli WB 3.3-2 = DSM 21788]